ncbi:hypothetical protein [Aliamphritea ceti]|uniref:hypothetical protein n=1 Tax=Aliamphritea ceti TaxID=1524258 RepID=UPI0021C3AF81|nr:hypothetical protein [Aliamphritea ceti]
MQIAEQAAAFKAAYAASGEPFGYETSCKLVPGCALTERFLISIHKDAFVSLGLKELLPAEVLKNVPADLWSWYDAGLPAADVVHFGFESSAKPVLKLYLESTSAFYTGLKYDSRNRIMVYDALKWGAELTPVNSQYVCRPEQSEEVLEQTIVGCFPVDQKEASQLAKGYLQQALKILPAKQLLMLEVEEQGSIRQSFDLNLYDLEQTVMQWADLIRDTWQLQQLDSQSLEMFLQTHGDKVLGHVSAGTGRDGQVFFTLYFGATEQVPEAT